MNSGQNFYELHPDYESFRLWFNACYGVEHGAVDCPFKLIKLQLARGANSRSLSRIDIYLVSHLGEDVNRLAVIQL